MYFGLLLDNSKVGVAESEKRVAAIFLLPVWPLEAPGRVFSPYSGLYCRRIAHRRLEMLSIRKLGAINQKYVDQKYNLESGSTFKNVRNGPKCREIHFYPKNV